MVCYKANPMQSCTLSAVMNTLQGYQTMSFSDFSTVPQDQFIHSILDNLQAKGIQGRERKIRTFARTLHKDLSNAFKEMDYNSKSGIEKFGLAILNFFASIGNSIAKLWREDNPDAEIPELQSSARKRCAKVLRDELRTIADNAPENIGSILSGLQATIQELDIVHSQSIEIATTGEVSRERGGRRLFTERMPLDSPSIAMHQL